MSKIELASKTKDELLRIAQRMGLRGISTLTKAELAASIHRAQERDRNGAGSRPMGVVAVAKRIADAVKRRAVRKREAVKAARGPTVTTKRMAAKPSRRGPSPIAARPASPEPAPGEETTNAQAEEVS